MAAVIFKVYSVPAETPHGQLPRRRSRRRREAGLAYVAALPETRCSSARSRSTIVTDRPMPTAFDW
jgi:hypothetical protein